MRWRCRNPEATGWHRYGGRGITVASRWDDFRVFLADLGPRPSPAHSIERIDNDGNYEPGNVVWATRREQNRNRTDNHWITFRGRRLILTEWARALGITGPALRRRLALWPKRDAMTRPRTDYPTHSRPRK